MDNTGCVPEFGKDNQVRALVQIPGSFPPDIPIFKVTLPNYVPQTLGETDFFASICQSPWQDFRNMSHLGLTLNTGLRCEVLGGSYTGGQFPRALMPKGLGFVIICHLNIKKINFCLLATSKALPRWSLYPNRATFHLPVVGLVGFLEPCPPPVWHIALKAVNLLATCSLRSPYSPTCDALVHGNPGPGKKVW